MQYDLTSDFDRERFAARVETLLQKCAVIELTERAFRSPSQNRYLHLLIGVVAMETGNTLEYCKEWYFKRLCNPDIFIIDKKDKFYGEIMILRSSKDLTKEEMSIAIDRFKRWGAENGIYMPNPEDIHLLQEIEVEMGRMKAYL